MAKPVSSPFQAMEEEAYHAFREWPILLVMRQKELAMHLAAIAAVPTSPDQTAASPVDPPSLTQVETEQR